jgi:hypothetical protein
MSAATAASLVAAQQKSASASPDTAALLLAIHIFSVMIFLKLEKTLTKP